MTSRFFIFYLFFFVVSCHKSQLREKVSLNENGNFIPRNTKYTYLYEGKISLKDLNQIRNYVNKYYIDQKNINLSKCLASGIRYAYDLLDFDLYPNDFYEKYKENPSVINQGLKIQSKLKNFMVIPRKKNENPIILTEKLEIERQIYDINSNLDYSEFEEEINFVFNLQMNDFREEEKLKQERDFKEKLLFTTIKGFLESLDNLTTIYTYDLNNEKIENRNPKDIFFHRIIGEKDKILYFNIKKFHKSENGESADSYVEKVLFKISEDSNTWNNSIVGIVIDLRGNEGGYLDMVGKFLEIFSPQGKLFSIESGRSKLADEYYNRKDRQLGKPIAILVDDKSSAGSEIIAGSLKEKKRAIVIGSKTPGLGTIQKISNIPENSFYYVKITTGRVLLPSGNEIQENGVEPDIMIENNFEYKNINKSIAKWNRLRAKKTNQKLENSLDDIAINLIRESKLNKGEYRFLSQDIKDDIFLSRALENFYAYIDWKK